MSKMDFSKNPAEILSVCLRHYLSNEKMSSELKDEIKSNISVLSTIPEGSVLAAIDPFLEANIFEHDLEDLVECGVYSFIYSMSLSLVAGSRKVGTE